MSGSAVNDGAGARTQVSLIVAWLAIIVTVVALTPLFTTLPEAVLGALIIHAVWHIIASRKLARIRKVSTTEWILGVVTFLGVILIDVLQGMIIGVVAAVTLFAFRASLPHVSRLGRRPTDGAWADVGRHPDAHPVPGVLVVRLGGPMYFANALTIRDTVEDMTRETHPPVRAVVIDMEAQDELDVTSAETLAALAEGLRATSIEVHFAALRTPVRDYLVQNRFLELPADRDHPTVEAAAAAIELPAVVRQEPEHEDDRPSG
jgi:MFS superfamily sulfate permease-like transporter